MAAGTYSESKQADFFVEQEKQRTADVKGLERYVENPLGTIFHKVLDPSALPIEQKPQRYSLFFCIQTLSRKRLV